MNPTPISPLLAFTAALLAAGGTAAAGWRPKPDATLCRVVPRQAVAELLGVAPDALSLAGQDLEKFHSCTASAGAAAVKVEHHVPGQPGLPADVASGLHGIRETIGKDLREFETRDFGNIGCYRGVLEFLGQRAHTTACFDPAGYFTIGASRPDASIPMESVRTLLEETAAAYRKG